MKTSIKILISLALFITSVNSYAGKSKALEFDVAMSNLSILSGSQQKAYLNIDISGLSNGFRSKRPQTNIAFVLDKSGSMSGFKMIQAKQAIEMAISRLNKDDIASLIVYDDEAKVLVPAIAMQNPANFMEKIKSIRADGSTALFAGVTQGSYEIRKFLDKNKVNRVILLSDGIANVGPSKPQELAELGRALSKQRISVSTIGLGLGYNEDLMTLLAGHSDGNHYFVEDADKLAQVFDSELGDIFSVVAQDIQINIRCKDGIKPIRILGRDENIKGQNISTNFNQIYGNQKRHITLEVMIPAGSSGSKKDIADVSIVYNDPNLNQQLAHNDTVSVTYTNLKKNVERDQNSSIYDKVTSLKANHISKKVVKLRDEGKLREAKEMQKNNIGYLNQQILVSKSPEQLKSQLDQEVELLDNLDKHDWNKSRKMVRAKQYNIDNQQKASKQKKSGS